MAATQRRELDAMRKELQVGVTVDEMYTMYPVPPPPLPARESLGVCGELMASGGRMATRITFCLYYLTIAVDYYG